MHQVFIFQYFLYTTLILNCSSFVNNLHQYESLTRKKPLSNVIQSQHNRLIVRLFDVPSVQFDVNALPDAKRKLGELQEKINR